jgi:hypothetical protein
LGVQLAMRCGTSLVLPSKTSAERLAALLSRTGEIWARLVKSKSSPQ